MSRTWRYCMILMVFLMPLAASGIVIMDKVHFDIADMGYSGEAKLAPSLALGKRYLARQC